MIGFTCKRGSKTTSYIFFTNLCFWEKHFELKSTEMSIIMFSLLVLLRKFCGFCGEKVLAEKHWNVYIRQYFCCPSCCCCKIVCHFNASSRFVLLAAVCVYIFRNFFDCCFDYFVCCKMTNLIFTDNLSALHLWAFETCETGLKLRK